MPSEVKRIFPPSLEVLRISEATHDTANILNSVCAGKIAGHLPLVRRVELYYIDAHHIVEALAARYHCLDPIKDGQRVCRDAEIELRLYFFWW